MHATPDDFLHHVPSFPVLVGLGIVLFMGCLLSYSLDESRQLSHIPFYSHCSIFPMLSSRILFFFDSRKVLYGGYWKYKGSVFRVLRWSGWLIVVTGHQLVEEIKRIPDDTLSVWEASKSEIQVVHTFGKAVLANPYQLPLLKSKFSRYFDDLIPQILDEAVPAFEEIIGRLCQGTSDWVEFNVHEEMQSVIIRTFNRVLVGQPLCRNESYNKLCAAFSVNIYLTSIFINLFPLALQNVLGRLTSQLPRFQRKAHLYLGPLIEERKALKDHGLNWDKSHDLLSWLMEEAFRAGYDTMDVVTRVLTVSSSTTHTSSYTFIQALVDLATHPSHIEPLRREAVEAVSTRGWTQDAIDSLKLLDSFFKESMRMHAIGSMEFPLKAVKSFTLSDGTYIPEGSIITTSFAVHFDEEYYENPYTFDGFRFAKNSDARVYNEMTKSSTAFMAFGHGRHASYAFYTPGRFIVAYVLKALMVQILLSHDIKLGGDGRRKPDLWFTYHCMPNSRTTVMLRRRPTNKD